MKCRALQDITLGDRRIYAGAVVQLDADAAFDLALLGEVEPLEPWRTVTPQPEPVVVRRIKWRPA